MHIYFQLLHNIKFWISLNIRSKAFPIFKYQAREIQTTIFPTDSEKYVCEYFIVVSLFFHQISITSPYTKVYKDTYTVVRLSVFTLDSLHWNKYCLMGSCQEALRSPIHKQIHYLPCLAILLNHL